LLTALALDGMLESAAQTPHILKVTPTQNDRTRADDHAAALARWDDELIRTYRSSLADGRLRQSSWHRRTYVCYQFW